MNAKVGDDNCEIGLCGMSANDDRICFNSFSVHLINIQSVL